MPKQRPEAVANQFLRRAGKAGLTQLQLQKLVYIAHGWTLAFSDQPLTSIEPEAWRRGPVYPDLRHKISHVGSGPITDQIHENDANPFAVLAYENRGPVIVGQFNEIETRIIDLVWGRYGHLHGFTLSDLTHEKGGPWHTTYYGRGRNAAISNDVTYRYYFDLATRLTNEQAAAAS